MHNKYVKKKRKKVTYNLFISIIYYRFDHVYKLRVTVNGYSLLNRKLEK